MADEPNLVDELKQMSKEYEPLLPVEKKLILWSLSIGIVSLVFFYWLSTTFFTGAN